MKKVLLIIASVGYQSVEYSAPKSVLEEAGFEVVTGSDHSGMAQAAYDGIKTKVDIVLDNIDIENFAGLFFMGGPGALENLDNEKSYGLLQNWVATGKPFGAICISPRILAKAGVLRGRKATGWDGDKNLAEIFAQNGVEYVKDDVVTDGDVVTASGPAVAKEFGEEILKKLRN